MDKKIVSIRNYQSRKTLKRGLYYLLKGIQWIFVYFGATTISFYALKGMCTIIIDIGKITPVLIIIIELAVVLLMIFLYQYISIIMDLFDKIAEKYDITK